MTTIEAKKHLKSLGYRHFISDGYNAWEKIYKGFKLVVALGIKGKIYGCIVVGKTEIGLGKDVTLDWIEEFDNDNIE